MIRYTSTENIPDEVVPVKRQMLNRISTEGRPPDGADAMLIDTWFRNNIDIFDDALRQAYERGRQDQ